MPHDTENPNSHTPYYHTHRPHIRNLATLRATQATHQFDSISHREFIAQRPIFVGHCSIHFPASNLQPLSEDAGSSSTNHGDELGVEVNRDAYIDIWDVNRYCNDRTDRQITYQLWKEHLDQRKQSRLGDSSVNMMSDTAAAVGAQAIGALVAAVPVTDNTAPSGAVKLFIVLGLTCTIAGICLRRKRLALSVLVTKLCVMATVSAVVIALAAHHPPVMMWTFGPVVFLILAVAVALA